MTLDPHSLRPDTSLQPDTLPPEIRDCSAWYGRDLAGHTDWIEHLSQPEIAEVEGAAGRLAALSESSFDLTTIGSDDFPLPSLGPRQLLMGCAAARLFAAAPLFFRDERRRRFG